MRKHTATMCADHVLEGKTCSQNTKRLMKKRIENEKKVKSVINHLLPKSKEW